MIANTVNALSIQGGKLVFYVSVPEFLSVQWITEQYNRIQTLVQRYVAMTGGVDGCVKVYWHEQRGDYIVVQAQDAATLQELRTVLANCGFQIEDDVAQLARYRNRG